MLARRSWLTLLALLAFAAAGSIPAGAQARAGKKAQARESHHRVAHSGRNRTRRVNRRRRTAPKPRPRPVVSTPPTGGTPTPADPNCTGADAVPDRAGASLAASAALCLVNRERAAAGLPALLSSPQLAVAATAHSADMVANGYFSHDSLDGRDLVERIRAAGWSTTGSWRAGENIAWGSGSYGSPRHIVRSWMNSPGHRANILNAAFREAGSGVAAGAPQRTSMGAGTYTMDFGARS
jgi:uncharacterized protein YkwD